MKKFIEHRLVTVEAWYRYNEKIFLIAEEGFYIEYLGTYSLSQLWLKATKGKKICVKIVSDDEKLGCLII